MNLRKVCVSLLSGFSQLDNTSLALIKLALKLLQSQLEATDVHVTGVYRLFQPLDVTRVFVGKAGCFTEIVLKALYVTLLSVVSVLHHTELTSEVTVVFILLCKDHV